MGPHRKGQLVKKLLLLLGLGALSGALIACGGETPASARTIQVGLSEFKFDPPELRLKAGETIKLVVRNTGALEHEFMIGRNLSQHGGAMAYGHDFMRGMRMDTHITGGTFGTEEHGEMMRISPGGTGQITMTVPVDRKGEWEMGCFLPGHYEAGMKGPVIVD